MTGQPTYEELVSRVAELEEKSSSFQVLEKALLESRNRYQKLLAAVTGYVFTVRVENRVPVETIHNPHCEAVTGYSLENFRTDHFLWINMVPEADRPIVKKQINAILAGERPSPIEHRIVRKDGSVRWVSNTSVPHYDATGNLLSYDGLINDITKRKEAQEALRKSEDRFRLLYEMTPLGYQSLDEEGCFVEVNRTWLETMGYSRKEVIGRSFGDFLIPGRREFFKKNFSDVNTLGEIIDAEFEMIKKDGSVVLVSLHGKVGRKPDGSFQQTHCILHDITEQRAFEEEREKLVFELKKALDEIRTLRGIIPICSYCKKIRDDHGVWSQLESYIHRHSEAEFSHGICPDCHKKHFADISKIFSD